MDLKPVTLTGKTVALIPLKSEQISGLFEAARHAEIWSYTSVKINNQEDMKKWVMTALKAQENGTALPFAILDRVNGQLLGSTRYFDISPADRHLEIGHTWLTPSVWRTRVNTECKYLLLRHCFEQLNTVRVQIKTDARNLRSQQAIERLGAVKEGVLRRHLILPDGFIRDTVLYSIIKEEWPEVKERLENFLDR